MENQKNATEDVCYFCGDEDVVIKWRYYGFCVEHKDYAPFWLDSYFCSFGDGACKNTAMSIINNKLRCENHAEIPKAAVKKSNMSVFLREVEHIVTNNRNVDYGDPLEDFSRTAKMWSAYLGVEIQPWQVSIMQMMLKISRLANNPFKGDSWLDIAGYSACGWHCIVETVDENSFIPF